MQHLSVENQRGFNEGQEVTEEKGNHTGEIPEGSDVQHLWGLWDNCTVKTQGLCMDRARILGKGVGNITC